MLKIAVDTNVLVRVLARDDDVQLERARQQLLASGFDVGTTVILEVEWVLRASLRFDRLQVNEALRSLFDLDGVTFAEPERVADAIRWHAAGMDFADAIHLGGAANCDEFVTFDRNFARRAASTTSATPVRLLQNPGSSENP